MQYRKLRVKLKGDKGFVITDQTKGLKLKDIALHTIGDAILEPIVYELTKRNPDIKGEVKQTMDQFLTSNAFLAQCNRPMRFKLKPDSVIGEHEKADRTEMWIYFIYVNYGKDAVKRYLLKELDKYYQKHF